MDPVSCKSPYKPLSEWDFIISGMEKKEECICENGIFPICDLTGKIPLCPDGNRANQTLTKLPPYLDLCQHSAENLE